MTHLKWEQSRGPVKFSFRWQCELLCSEREGSIRGVNVAVTDYEFEEGTSPADKAAVLSVLRPWFVAGLEFTKLLNK